MAQEKEVVKATVALQQTAASPAVQVGSVATAPAGTHAPVTVTAGAGSTSVEPVGGFPQQELQRAPQVRPDGQPVNVQKWKFVKTFGPADVLRFSDGTSFQFRLIQRSDKSGYAPTSEAVITDEKLAANLREAAKNRFAGVVEVKP